MPGQRVVDFFEISSSRSVITEVEDLLTERQLAAFHRNIKRLEARGWDLDAAYFGKVRGSKERLYEYRLTLDKVEVRLLFAEEGNTFVMLAAYKEKRNAIPPGKIESAEERLKIWRQRNQ